jgi:hypothetical protein
MLAERRMLARAEIGYALGNEKCLSSNITLGDLKP